MENTKHLWIALLIVVAVGAGGALVLSLGVPSSFGWRDGWQYRGESLEEQKNRPMAYAEEGSCLRPECHGEKAAKEEFKIILKGGHKSIQCQACHGPALKHVESQGKEHEPVASKENDLCMNCHAKLTGRPASVKQIEDFEKHKKDMGGEKEKTCIECHDSHTCEVN
jgi:hypothetical protein